MRLNVGSRDIAEFDKTEVNVGYGHKAALILFKNPSHADTSTITPLSLQPNSKPTPCKPSG